MSHDYEVTGVCDKQHSEPQSTAHNRAILLGVRSHRCVACMYTYVYGSLLVTLHRGGVVLVLLDYNNLRSQISHATHFYFYFIILYIDG